MSDPVEIKLHRKLPELDPEAAEAYNAAMLEMYHRGRADAKAELCEDCSYKGYYAKVAAQSDCNDCGKARTCPHVPRPGAIVRINCPLWLPKIGGQRHAGR